MSLSQSSCNHYSLLADSDSNDNFRAVRNSKERFMFPRVFFIVCLTALFLVVGFIAGSFHLLANDNGIVTLSKTRSCVNPKARREWRSLSTSEKSEYIHAVQCLLATPSRLGLNHSAYDDFPLVHSLVGGYCTFLISYPRKRLFGRLTLTRSQHTNLLHFLPGIGISFMSMRKH